LAPIGKNRSWSRQQGKTAADSGIGKLRSIVPLSLVGDVLIRVADRRSETVITV